MKLYKIISKPVAHGHTCGVHGNGDGMEREIFIKTILLLWNSNCFVKETAEAPEMRKAPSGRAKKVRKMQKCE